MRRFEDVLWSDENVFTMKLAKNPQKHRQLLSPALKNTSKRKFATRSLFVKSLMVWGGISASGKTPLIFIDKNVKIDANFYQKEILEKALLSWKQNHPNFIFQQDGAPAHAARSTIRFLETEIGNFLTKDLWPSNSPDLNPLDFAVWGYMEGELRNRNVRSLVALRKEVCKSGTVWASATFGAPSTR